MKFFLLPTKSLLLQQKSPFLPLGPGGRWRTRLALVIPRVFPAFPCQIRALRLLIALASLTCRVLGLHSGISSPSGTGWGRGRLTKEVDDEALLVAQH